MEIEECMFYPQFCRVRRVFYQSLHHIRNIDTAATTQKNKKLSYRRNSAHLTSYGAKGTSDILNSLKKERRKKKESAEILRAIQKLIKSA